MPKREERHEGFRSRFLTKLAEEANARGVICGNANYSWSISKAVSRLRNAVPKGINMNYVISMDSARVEMWIYHGSEQEGADSAYEVFRRHFLSNKSEIEKAYGASLNWDSPNRTTGVSVQQDYPDFRLSDVPRWDYWVDKMVTDMKKLDEALIAHYT